MRKGKPVFRRGFTLVGLMIASVLVSIVTFGIGVVLVDSQRGWQAMYNRVYSGVATDGYVAGKMFNAVIRKASGESFLLDDAGNWIEVYYYEDENSSVVDRYVRFYYDNDGEDSGRLSVEYGKLNPRGRLSVQTVCENVSGCVFRTAGRSAQMILTLTDSTETSTIVSCGVMHN